jgi:hypothetical protein
MPVSVTIRQFPYLLAFVHGALSANAGGTEDDAAKVDGVLPEIVDIDDQLHSLSIDFQVAFVLGQLADDGYTLHDEHGKPLLVYDFLNRRVY